MAGSEYVIEMLNITKEFPGIKANDNITLQLRRGEIHALLGENGAGKSTILKSITRQLERISGGVILDGTDIQAMSYKALASRMAVVLTDRIKAELMTCHDIVASGRYPYTGKLGILTSDDEQKVEEALAMVHAGELGMRDFANISDGQRQRVLLARAICQEPDVMILDEPTSFLDVKYKLELLSILRRMAKEKNITVIMSLHEIDLADREGGRFCQRDAKKRTGTGNVILRSIFAKIFQRSERSSLVHRLTLLHMYFAYIFCKIHIYNTFFMNYVNSDFSRHTRCTPAIPLNSQSTMPISL